MSAELENELPLRSYLLGNLNQDAQQRIEQQLMTDSAAFDELLCVEDELIEDYLENTLSEKERHSFENYFLLAPERQRQLAFTRTLKRYVAEQKQKNDSLLPLKKPPQSDRKSHNGVFKWLLAAALLIMIGGGSWQALRISRLRNALERAGTTESPKQLMEAQRRNSELGLALQREQAKVLELGQEAASLKNSTANRPQSLLQGQLRSTIISITLAPGLLRDLGGMQRILVPAGTELAQIDLKLESQDFPQYQATLRRVEESNIWSQTSAGIQTDIQGQFFRLIMPANLLRPGDYVLKLSGIRSNGGLEDVGNYYFRIVAK